MSGLCAHNIPFFLKRYLAKLKVYQAQNSIVKNRQARLALIARQGLD
jgi:hypothetical protein